MDPEPKAKPPTIYFGVHIPNDVNNGQANVFVEKEAALNVCKKHKKSRFKSFQFYHEAEAFSINGIEFPNNNGAIPGEIDKKDNNQSVGEKSSPFRAPRPQDLTEFRAQIEKGNNELVRELIEANPRYLVSSGDTPAILQEGARLNALHVAAKSKNAEIAEYVLNTISNPDFIKKLYGDDNQQNAEQRCKMLLDLYLNTPNKGFNDTPLHIASKWGAEKVMEVLLSYPECDKDKKNKHNHLAENVICERVDFNMSSVKRMQQLLCNNYYVPVLRTEDNTMPPLVGEPFSPTSPPVFNQDPLNPRLEIHAYAGPMDLKEAESFKKVWKTPPRSFSFNSSNGKRTPVETFTSLRRKDPEKGLELIGKKLANNFNVDWKEYWEFLDSFVDIASEEGLEMLENHLREREKLEESFKEKQIVVSPMTSLCNAFSDCKIEDNSGFCEWTSPVDMKEVCRPLVYVDKACQVFANRIFPNVLIIMRCSQLEYETTAYNLEADIKLLELLINSYMDDERFGDWVNFQKLHSRLAHLIARKLKDTYNDCDPAFLINKVQSMLDNVDYFSSDDEANCKETNKPTGYRKQVVCLLSRIKHTLESPVYYEIDEDNLTTNGWKFFETCSCIFRRKKQKRNNLSRNNSLKNPNYKRRHFMQGVSKKLNFGEDIILNGSVTMSSDSSKSDSDDDFKTPPSSPTNELEPDSEDQFSDAENVKEEVYLEGNHPTKTDWRVFKALIHADCDIDEKKYPKVYFWHHCISLYSEEQRKSWPSPHSKAITPPLDLSPVKSSFPPQKPSWLRVTGVNSPRAAFKSFSDY